MPTVKEYRNDNGYYIRSNINGRYVTLQLSPEAEGLFSDLGIREDDQISWQFLKPLCDCGHAYTNNSGTEVTTNDISATTSVPSGELSSEKQQRLEEFIEQHSPKNAEEKEVGSAKNSGPEKSPLEAIDGAKRKFIEKWSPSDDEYEATVNRVARANNMNGILKSIAHHSTEHPILVNRFRVNSQDVPTYSFDTDGIPWTVHDFRTTNKSGTDAELFIDIRPGTNHSQSITIGSETIEWHTRKDQFTSEQITDFVAVAPDILYYIKHLVKGPDISPLEIVSESTADISPEDESRIEALKNLQKVEPSEYGRALGAILTLESKGYGRIRAHTGHTFAFSENDIKGENVEPNNVVIFNVKPHRGTLYADSIKKEETGIPSSEIVRNWTEWSDRSPSWLRENWGKGQEEPDANQRAIFLGSPDDQADRQCVEIQIDSLALYLAKVSNSTNEVIDNAVRTLLKETIDGTRKAPREPVATNNVEISLPSNLHSMIESIVKTSSVYDTQSQFFNAALQHHIDEGDEVELTLRVPRSYHDAVQHLSEEHESSTSQFIRAALEDTLRTEFSRKQEAGLRESF